MLFSSKGNCYCPICKYHFQTSEYLKSIFGEGQVLWLANMVTHYRHTHISSWNRCFGKYGGSYRGHWFKDYDLEKAKVNERAKRQIIRKAKVFMLEHDVNFSHVSLLQGNDESTILIAKKHLRQPSEEEHLLIVMEYSNRDFAGKEDSEG